MNYFKVAHKIESRLKEIEFQLAYDVSIPFSDVCNSLYNTQIISVPSETRVIHFINNYIKNHKKSDPDDEEYINKALDDLKYILTHSVVEGDAPTKSCCGDDDDHNTTTTTTCLEIVRHLKWHTRPKRFKSLHESAVFDFIQTNRQKINFNESIFKFKKPTSPSPRLDINNNIVGIFLFQPFQFMLASPCTSRQIIHDARSNPNWYAIEPCYNNGRIVRIQVHYDSNNNVVEIYKHGTHELKKISNIVNIEEKEKSVFIHGLSNCILDGIINNTTGEILFFDCLYFNNETCHLHAYRQRRKYLSMSVHGKYISPILTIQSLYDDYFNHGKSHDVIIKSLNNPYEMGTRLFWHKSKSLTLFNNTNDMSKEISEKNVFNLVIVGANYSSSSSSLQHQPRRFNCIFVACFDSNEHKYHVVSKISSGLRDVYIDMLDFLLKNKMTNRQQPPDRRVVFNKTMYPDAIIVNLEKSFLIQVRVNRVMIPKSRTGKSASFKLAFVMPRVLHFRQDLDLSCTTTRQELEYAAASQTDNERVCVDFI